MSIVDFEGLYAADPDPWRVATDWYEQRKIDLVLACLRRRTYPVAWDAGCGTGELAARLAMRSGRVLATDASPRAVAITRSRCATNPQVEALVGVLPELPDALGGAADLVVLSEVLYYLTPDQRAATAKTVRAACTPDADVLAVHWSERPEDALADGLDCHRELDWRLLEAGFGRLVAHRDEEFTLTLWSRDVPATIGRPDF